MAEKHPDELELLSFVEEELDDGARREVAEHLVACRTCAGQIRRLETARDALRAAPLLELPEQRRAEIMAGLPERRDPWRRFRPAKRVLVIAVPVAAAAALAGVFVLAGTPLGGSGDSDESAAGGGRDAAATMMEQAPESTRSEAVPELDKAATLVRSAQGPAAEIVRMLESKGIRARAESSHSVLAEAPAGKVRAALTARPDGDVAVYIQEP